MLISRTDRGLVANWWFTVDRLLMAAILVMMAAGVLLSMAASPPVALRIGLNYFHFFDRQLIYLTPAIGLMVAMSLMNARQVRRVALWAFFGGLVLMGLAIMFGPEIKGAHRWINIGSLRLQPSEFVKPAFVVLSAWLLAEGKRRVEVPGELMAWSCFAAFITMLVLSPDFGQTALVCMVWAVMLLVYGIPWLLVAGLGAMATVGAVMAYNLFPHVASRVDRFINPEGGDTYQVDRAIEAFTNGGLLGTGPGGGIAKQKLPDAHTDFIFAVVGEEFGAIACIVLIGLVVFIAMRVLRRAGADEDGFVVLALTGLASIFAFQSIINMAVNVSLIPAKGMTLPFISYGGSSLIATALGMGMVLALCRKRPRGVAPIIGSGNAGKQ